MATIPTTVMDRATRAITAGSGYAKTSLRFLAEYRGIVGKVGLGAAALAAGAYFIGQARRNSLAEASLATAGMAAKWVGIGGLIAGGSMSVLESQTLGNAMSKFAGSKVGGSVKAFLAQEAKVAPYVEKAFSAMAEGSIGKTISSKLGKALPFLKMAPMGKAALAVTAALTIGSANTQHNFENPSGNPANTGARAVFGM